MLKSSELVLTAKITVLKTICYMLKVKNSPHSPEHGLFFVYSPIFLRKDAAKSSALPEDKSRLCKNILYYCTNRL